MAGEEDIHSSTLNSQLSHTKMVLKEEMERGQSQVDILEAKLGEVTSCMHESSEDAKKELEVLWRRVKTTTTLLTYLESKARIMTIPHLALTSCGIKPSDGEGFIDRSGAPMSSWSGNMKFPKADSREVETWIGINSQHGHLDEQDGSYMGEILSSVQTVTDVMESLVKRVLVAESESSNAKKKVTLGQEEIKKKAIQIETMSEKLDEMDRFAIGTNCVLNEMRQRVEDLVEETSRQRQRAAENEQELTRVKQEFESLKSYVSSLISVRETLVSSEKQFQTIERLFERLVVKTTQLESEKMQKEAEVQKLMDENMKLSALLDKKEAQLLAMNEQCKVMALSASNI
ncbi:hypothetical protein OSB04_000532 [Centaurea solstitialis]|uniref:Uncharacterized protein n=1 Tax=Centaurea solstitialis TaxID=347529 RepID=A0AA38TZT4_9ASTR|nr:hypothetical protein OSB04_000532 [Centaurea solstitialis]